MGYKFNGIARFYAARFCTRNRRLDAITKGKIVELKNYDWSKYRSYKSVISSFRLQARRYTQLVGKKINGQTIKSVEFYFSSKPPRQVIDALKRFGVKVRWVK